MGEVRVCIWSPHRGRLAAAEAGGKFRKDETATVFHLLASSSAILLSWRTHWLPSAAASLSVGKNHRFTHIQIMYPLIYPVHTEKFDKISPINTTTNTTDIQVAINSKPVEIHFEHVSKSVFYSS